MSDQFTPRLEPLSIVLSADASDKKPSTRGLTGCGFSKRIAGQELKYHSPHPDADQTLLLRAKTGFLNIEWETEVVPDPMGEEKITFIWLSAMGGPQWAPHNFRLFVDDMYRFTFSTCADLAQKDFEYIDNAGASLTFTSTLVDTRSDVFGYFFLTLPTNQLTPGKPLRLRVEADDEGSSDWLLVFQYTFDFKPRFRIEPLILRTEQGARQTLRMVVDALNCGQVAITPPASPASTHPLQTGANILPIPIPVIEQDAILPIRISYPDGSMELVEFPVQPVAKRDVYLIPYSHNDIGYTNHQSEVQAKQWRNIEQAITLWEETKHLPDGCRSKWNLEVIWALESWLEQASPDWIARFRNAVKEGGLGLNALWANFLTGLACEEELAHFVKFAKSLQEKYGITIDTAVQTDIPGFSWGIVKALADAGVKYFSIAPNEFDRVGHIYEMGDQPFYWLSPNGNEKILTWIAGASYSLFHQGELSKLGDERLLQYLRKLDATKYPYELAFVPYTIGGDNGPPDPTLPPFVAEWNERYVSPTLRIATHHEFFHDFINQYGESFPERSGDLTGYWEDGAMSTAAETIQCRNAVDMLLQAEATNRIFFAGNAITAEESEAVWQNIRYYDEHTWGAFNSVSEPELPSVVAQWVTKQKFAVDAYDGAAKLLRKTLQMLSQQAGVTDELLVVNTLPWDRHEIVTIPSSKGKQGNCLQDETGEEYPLQRSANGEAWLASVPVPANSYRKLSFVTKEIDQSKTANESNDHLENDFLSITLDAATGAIQSLITKSDGKEWVDGKSGFGIGQFLYVPGADPNTAQQVANVKCTLKETGGVRSSLLVTADAPGCSAFECEFSIPSDRPQLEIRLRIDKETNRKKEAAHLAFPLQVPEGIVRYDVAGGIVIPERNQLPGACKNFYSAQSWFDVSNAERGMACALLDTPLIETGAITVETGWLREGSQQPPVFIYLLNNYWHTNYKADQEGIIEYRFVLMPHGRFDPSEIARFGKGCRQPLLVA
ncbi:MAG: hypothetical protein OEM52_05890 [bacterium]|nr:hypothetical protein [bacterium]